MHEELVQLSAMFFSCRLSEVLANGLLELAKLKRASTKHIFLLLKKPSTLFILR